MEQRKTILSAAAKLLADGGREAVTTRAVADAAGVQGPTIYRLFGDKRGLLNALAEEALRSYVTKKKAVTPLEDPLEDLRRGCDLNIEFSLAHPDVFVLMNADPSSLSPAAAAGIEVLSQKVRRLAQAGLLSVTEERAVDLIRSAGIGTVFTLLGKEKPDLSLSAQAFDLVIAAITVGKPKKIPTTPKTAAIALRASIDDTSTLTPGERHLLAELLDRLARA